MNRYRVVSCLVQCPNPHPGRGSHCLLEAASRQPQKMQTNVRQARVQILLAIPPRDVKSSSSHRKEAPEGNAQGGRSAPVANTCSTAVHPESTPEWIDGQGVKRRWCTACKNHMAKAPVQASVEVSRGHSFEFSTLAPSHADDDDHDHDNDENEGHSDELSQSLLHEKTQVCEPLGSPHAENLWHHPWQNHCLSGPHRVTTKHL